MVYFGSHIFAVIVLQAWSVSAELCGNQNPKGLFLCLSRNVVRDTTETKAVCGLVGKKVIRWEKAALRGVCKRRGAERVLVKLKAAPDGQPQGFTHVLTLATTTFC